MMSPLNVLDEPISLKSQRSDPERVETPMGMDKTKPLSAHVETSSDNSRSPKRVSKRLEERFDSIKTVDVAETSSRRPGSGTVSNLPVLLKSVASLAEVSGVSVQDVWQDIRGYAQVGLLERLVKMAEEVDEADPGGFVFKPQSVGLCYVNPTESVQRGCETYDPLPPVTIRPIFDASSMNPASVSASSTTISENLLSGKTVTSVIASISSEEHVIKRYLLEPSTRSRILQLYQGSLMTGEDLGKLFGKAGDKGFVCYHYRLDRESDKSLVLRGLPNVKGSLAASNAQLVVTVKRGVGGTAGMKGEARLLDKGALLGLLLGEDPESLLKYYATLSKIESLEKGDPSAAKNLELSAEDEEVLEDRPVAAEKKLPLHSLCCRVDLYLDKGMWASLTQREVSELMAATTRFGEHFSELIRKQNWQRHLDHLRTIREAIMKELDHEDCLHAHDACTGAGIGLDAIRDQIDALLADAMGNLHSKDTSGAALGQQSFLKMHVSCLALAASYRRSHGHGHASHMLPMYMVSTRDCFSSDVVGEESHITTDAGRGFFKTRWFMFSAEIPANYDSTLEGLCTEVIVPDAVEDDVDSSDVEEGKGMEKQRKDMMDTSRNGGEDSVTGMVSMVLDGMVSTIVHAAKTSKNLQPDCADNYLLPLGVTTYNGLYDRTQLNDIESSCDELHQQSIKGILPKESFHETSTKTGSLRRTKYFFGSRYLWSREQLRHPQAKIAGGIRRDVPKPPMWMKEMVERPIVSADLVPEGFVDAIALNMYHDGSEGIQSHYDDAKRFQQPIYSLRLFSDSRLSFGTQLYGFTNGLFFVPMPRGCVTVMEDAGYAANGVKHCVRPIDMTGKSAAMILRKINENARSVAEELFWKESLRKLESLSLEPTSPEDLIWNPLFDSDSKMDKETSLLLQMHRNEKKEARLITALLKSMVKEVIVREKRQEIRKRKLKEIMSGMVKRVCTAERLGIDLYGGTTSAEPGDASEGGARSSHVSEFVRSQDLIAIDETVSGETLDLFNLVDDMISFVEHPAHSLKRKLPVNFSE